MNTVGRKEVPQRVREQWNRKTERGRKRGRDLEKRLRVILAEMKEQGKISGFTHHAPFSAADLEGKDFTVFRQSGDRNEKVSFDVTISQRSSQEHLLYHPDIPSIIIPPEMRTERIEQRILELFECDVLPNSC